MLAGHERTHLGVAIERIAEPDPRRLLDQRLEHPIVDGALDEQPRSRRAHFALVRERAEQRAVDRRIEIGVGEHDVRDSCRPARSTSA